MRLLTTQEAADILAVTEKRIHELCRDGLLSYVRIDGRGTRRVTPEQIHSFIESQKVPVRKPVDRKPVRALPSPQKGGEKEVVGVDEKGLSSLRKEIEALCQ